MKKSLVSLLFCICTPFFLGSARAAYSAAAGQLVSSSPLAAKAGGSGDSGLAILSPDGRFVLFASTANNLTPTNNYFAVVPTRCNLYLRDTWSDTTTLVSVNQAGSGGGNGDSFPTGLSTNGQFVLFESSASDLVANATNTGNIFVRDVVNGITTLVSIADDGGSANGPSRGSVLTPDGRWVAFTSAATNLVAGDTNKLAGVFVRDWQAGTTTLVSGGAVNDANPSTLYTASSPTASSSESPEITPDGRYVVFYSTATNLVPGATNAGDVYVRDVVAGQTFWASTNARAIFKTVTGVAAAVCCNYSLSADGRFVAYEILTNSLTGTATHGIILRYGLQTGLTDIIHTNACVQMCSFELIHDLALTPDGRFVAFAANLSSSSPSNSAICLWDAQTGTNTLVSVSTNNVTPANGFCDSPVVSTNGQFVAFLSAGNNLVTNGLAGQCHVYVRDLSAGVTQLLGTDTNGVGAEVDAITVPALSADGSVVVFECANLLSDNRHLVRDVFAHNAPTGATSLVSAANPALPSQTPDGSSGFISGSVSSNGQFVAFYSVADNLAPGDTNGCGDVFVHNLVGGTNILVSVNTNGNGSGDGPSYDATISADGRYVAFTSAADNLVAGDANQVSDVFVRDCQVGTTTLVSVSLNQVNSGNGASSAPVISANGRYVMFQSLATNLAAGPFASGTENLFFRDLQTGTTYVLTGSGVSSAAMTPDGQFVAFIGVAAGLGGSPTQLYVWNSSLNARTYTNSAASSTSSLAISPNGQKVAFLGNSPMSLLAADVWSNTVETFCSGGVFLSHLGLGFSANGQFLTCALATNSSAGVFQNVYRFDLQAGTNQMVSQNGGTASGGNANSDWPAISPDGRFIAYRSFATNLGPVVSNPVANVFLYDTANNTTLLVSANAASQAGAASPSLQPGFSADGRMLFFQSWASDIAGNDFNSASDLFALDLAALPALAGGGGATNAASGLVVQLLSTGALHPAPILSWPLASGQTYQVQYKTNLTDPVWLDLPGYGTFLGGTGYASDLAPAPIQRFYRVVLNP